MDRSLIVLLGEGNFSFACRLARKLFSSSESSKNSIFDLIATDFRESVDYNDGTTEDEFLSAVLERKCSLDESIRENIKYLSNTFDVPVWLDVDSTKLEFHNRLIERISNGKYSSISFIFNFPHVHNVKMKINLNRDLLKNTFESIEALLSSTNQSKLNSKVYVSLCHGQSGLNEVEPEEKHRCWADSWQLTEMASQGNFVLTNVVPFDDDFVEDILKCNEILNLKILESEFEHNLKCFLDVYQQNSNLENVPGEKSILEHESFGYRLQNRPFNQQDNRFSGGNVFIFEHRTNILSTLGFHDCDLFNKPIVQTFTEKLKEILQGKCLELKFDYRVDGDALNLLPKHWFDIKNIPETSIQELLMIIMDYLEIPKEKRYIDQNFTDSVNMQYFNFGNLRPCEICLNIEDCFRIKWKVKNAQILYSNYLIEMSSPGESGTNPIITTRLLYPRTYSRDVSFWIEKSLDNSNKDIENEFRNITLKLLGPNLLSICLKDRYVKSSTITSYCFGIQIRSLDLGLNRWKVAVILKMLQEQILKQIPNVSLR